MAQKTKADIDKGFAEFFKGYNKNLKGDNTSKFADEFVSKVSTGFGEYIEESCRDIRAIQNSSRFKKRLVQTIAVAYLHGVEDQKNNKAVNVLSIFSRVETSGLNKLKKADR